MTRVKVVVEGQTEESFIENILAPTLHHRAIYLTPILLGRSGGRPTYARVQKDILLQLKQDRTAYCSTMLDFYGLGAGFPGTPTPEHLSNIEKVKQIEAAVKGDISERIPDFRPDVRFIPYIQLHEFEGLLFSAPEAFARGINQPGLAPRFQAVRDKFASPEDINNNRETAPSKRVIEIYRSYRKVLHGTQAAAAVTIGTMRQECRHFREWIEQLERLEPDLPAMQS